MKRFAEIVNGKKPLTIFIKCSILDVSQGSNMPLGQMRFNAERNIAICYIFSHQIKIHRGFNMPLHNTTQHIAQVQIFKMMWNRNHFLSNISNRNTILGNQNLMVNFLLRKTFRGNLN